MGSKVPYGVEEPRSLTEAAQSLWASLWQHIQDPFSPGSAFANEQGAMLDCLPEPLTEYGKPLAQGIDTIEECYSVQLAAGVLEEMENAKQAAADITERAGTKTPVLVSIGAEEWQMSPNGAKGGIRYWLASDWCEVKIRPGQSFGVSIRYRSEALWSYGPEELIARARLWLSKVAYSQEAGFGLPKSPIEQWNRLSEIHHAVDVFSSRLSEEMEPELWRSVVAPAGVKAFPIGDVSNLSDAELSQLITDSLNGPNSAQFLAGLRAGISAEGLSCFASGGKMQTLTIGFRRPCEIQVYDKGREIREASGKEWMLDLWEQSGWERPADGSRPKDCWRIEVRIRGNWMRDRGVVTWDDWLERGQRLLVEALSSRRLTRPNQDTNRSRWPAHELWQIAACVIGYCRELAPLGRRFLDTAKQRAKQMIQQAVGNVRAACVVMRGDWRFDDMHRILYGSPDEEMTLLGVWSRDENQVAKIDELIERYRYIPRAA